MWIYFESKGVAIVVVQIRAFSQVGQNPHSNQDCKAQELEFEESKKLAEEQQAAIKKAVSSLNDLSARTPSTPAFIQLSASKQDVWQRALTRLKTVSPKLSALAMSVEESSNSSQSPDPFDNVRKMIRDMISKLKTKQSEEMESTKFCEVETKKSEAQISDKKKKMEKQYWLSSVFRWALFENVFVF